MNPEEQAILNMVTTGLDTWTITFNQGQLYLHAEIPECSLTKTREVDGTQLFKTKPIAIKPVHYLLFIKMLEYASIAHQIAMQSQVPPNIAELSPEQKREFVKSLPLNKRQELVANFEEMIGYIEELEDR